jgi:hypothetical protein
MLSQYHIEITKRSLGPYFTPATLQEIVGANIGQDSLLSLFGVEPHRHVCDCTLTQSLAYVEDEHARIAELSQTPGGEREQRAAFGRLLHTVQDFYAHTNYIALWLAETGGAERIDTATINGLDPQILAHPALRIAQWVAWRDPFYYLPVVGNVMRRFWLPEASHEAIHLDSPDRGSLFPLALAVACQHTLVEYWRAVKAIGEVGGKRALARFHSDEYIEEYIEA